MGGSAYYPFWDLGKSRFMPPIEHAALPKSLLDRFRRKDTPIAVDAVPAISGTTFKDSRDHLR
jgi:hypothetical protein